VPPGAKDSSKAKAAPPITESYPARVAVYGDSLAMQARPHFKLLIAAADQSSTTYYSSFVGTAICDWLPRMRQLAATSHFEAVVLEFSGNALTPCMAGITDYTPAYCAKYRADTMRAVAFWVPTGAHVFLVGAPVTRAQQASVRNWDALDRQYAQIAAADPQHVTYVDAGAAVEGPGGTCTRTLPCFIGEPCTGPVVKGVPSTWSAPLTVCTSAPWPRWTNRAVSTPLEPSGSPMPWCARSPLPSGSPWPRLEARGRRGSS
jgi:hypothetical protein